MNSDFQTLKISSKTRWCRNLLCCDEVKSRSFKSIWTQKNWT